MRKLMNRLAILSLIALPIAATTAIAPAGAATGAHLRLVAVHPLVHSDQPNTNIVGQGATAKFVPHKIFAPEDTSGNACTTGFVSLTITNTGTKKAFLYYGGGLLAKLAPAAVGSFCGQGFGAGTSIIVNLGSKTGTIYANKLKIVWTS